METILKSPSRSSTEVVCEIITLHQSILGAAKTTIEKAIRIGELLTEIKSSMKHGQWLPWVKENLPFSQQTASNYMRVFEKREKLPTVGNLTPADAYRLLSGPRELQVDKFIFHEAREFVDNLPDAETLAGDLSPEGWKKFESLLAETRSIVERGLERIKETQNAGECLEHKQMGERLAQWWHAFTTHTERFMGTALNEIETANDGRTP